MRTQTRLYVVYQTLGLLFLLSCAILSTTPTPDPVATRVAVQEAAAATLTAEAPTAVPTEAPAETSTPANPTSTTAPSSTSTSVLTFTPRPSETPSPTYTSSPAPTFTPLPAPTDTPIPTLSGRLLYVSNCDGDFEIYLRSLGTNPSITKLTNNSDVDDWFPDWSSDGRRIVFTSNRTGNYDLFVMNADGSDPTVFVDTPAWDEYGNWEPGSNRIVFSTTAETNGKHNAELFRRNADGSLTRLTGNQVEVRNPDWHPSGEIYYASNAGGNWDIFVLATGAGSDTGQSRNLTNHPAIDEDPALSPGYDRLLFVRKETDTNGDGQVGDGDTGNIYVMNRDGSGIGAVTTSNLDSSPAWSPDGRWVIYARTLASGSRNSNLYVTYLADGTTLQLTTDTACANWGAAWIE